MDEERILERERYQIEQIRQLEMEELQVEEVGESDDEDDYSAHIYVISHLKFNVTYGLCVDVDIESVPDPRGGDRSGHFTFDTCLASLHTYLGDVEDTHRRLSFLDGGAVLILPLFHLQGVVLFPEATLPLRVVQPNFTVAIERAMNQADAQYTLGIVHVYWDSENERMKFATTGTTAEIRQYRRLDDGSLNVVTRGQQRFRLKRSWMDVEGTPYAEVQIVQEDSPLRMPQEAYGVRQPFRDLGGHGSSHIRGSHDSLAKQLPCGDEDNHSEDSFEAELSPSAMRLHQSAIDSCCGHDIVDEATSSDEEKFVCESEFQSGRSHLNDSVDSRHAANNSDNGNASTSTDSKSISCRRIGKGEKWKKRFGVNRFNQSSRVSKAFLPLWVYQMYDSYCLAQKLADMWKQIIGKPNMDGFVKKPDLLSFYIASQIPVSESAKQELLEIDGISYRLRREIELLESFDRIRCKNCQTVIARRSDMLVMTNEGPLGAYVNPHGYVHEVMTFLRANGLALIGRAVKEYSWFPGYAWTITNCATCETQMGWLFTATNKKLKPRSFWGIRSCQVADDMR